MEKFWTSIRFKTVGIQVAGALAITISLAIACLFIIKQYLLKSDIEHSHMVVQTVTEEIAGFLQDRAALMERITISREFEEYLKTFRELPLSRHFSKFNKHFSTLAFLNKQGEEEVKVAKGKNTTSEMNHIRSVYYQRSLEQPNSVIISSPEKSPATGDAVLSMFLTKTGYFGDEFIGTLMTELPLIMIEKHIEKVSESKHGYIAVIDKDGQVIMSTSANKTQLHRTVNQDILAMAGSPDYGTIFRRATVFGTDSLVTAAPLKDLQWTVLRIEPYKNITGPLMLLMKSIVILLVFIMLLTIIGSLIISGQITKRIVELSEATTLIAQGNYTLNVPVTSNDEIGGLAESFNKMVDSLCSTTVSREELKEKNAFLQHVVDSLPYPFFVVDVNDLTVSLSNEAVGNYSTDKSITCFRMAGSRGIPCLWCDGHCTLLSVSETKQPAVFEILDHEGDVPRFYQIHAFPIMDRNGNVAEIIEYSVDITDKRLAGRELETYARKLKASNDDLQNFLHIASHDLNEPLRKVIAFGDRLKGMYHEVLGERGIDYLARMQSAAGRMQILLNDLLAYSRVTTKARPYEPTDLSGIIKEVLEVLDMKIEQTGAQVIAGELAVLKADPLQLRQVLQNLIGNALKFSRKDRPPLISIHGSFIKSRVTNGRSSAGEYYELIIEDNGIGFSEDHAERIFGVFEKLHARSEYEGSGVGLSICRKIIERHGGTIKAKGDPGNGAKFIIKLPVNL